MPFASDHPLKAMNSKSFIAFASLAALAAFGRIACRSVDRARAGGIGRSGRCGAGSSLGGAVILDGQRRPISDLEDPPDTDFRMHTLDLVGVSMGGWGLKDEILRWLRCRT